MFAEPAIYFYFFYRWLVLPLAGSLFVNPANPEGSPMPFSVQYEEANVLIHEDEREVSIHDLSTLRRKEIVLEIVKVEQPVHFEEIVLRIRDAFQWSRAGDPSRNAVKDALDLAVESNQLTAEKRNQVRGGEKDEEDRDVFYSLSGGQSVTVRDRRKARSKTPLDVRRLPPAELREAIIHVVSNTSGVAKDRLVREIAGLLGKRVSDNFTAAVDEQIGTLVETGRLERRDGDCYAAIPLSDGRDSRTPTAGVATEPDTETKLLQAINNLNTAFEIVMSEQSSVKQLLAARGN